MKRRHAVLLAVTLAGATAAATLATSGATGRWTGSGAHGGPTGRGAAGTVPGRPIAGDQQGRQGPAEAGRHGAPASDPAGAGGYASESAPASGITGSVGATGPAAQLEQIYALVRQEVTSVSPASPALRQLPPVSDYDRLVAALPPSSVARLAGAAAQTPGWAGLPAALQAAGRKARQLQGAASARSVGARDFPPSPPPGSFPPPPTAYQPTSPVGPAQVPATCPPPAPGQDLGSDAVFSAQLSLDITNEAATALPGDVGFLINSVPFTIPDPAKQALMIVADAEQVLLDTVLELNAVFADCGNIQAIGTAANIDNSTFNTWNLLQIAETTVGAIQSSVNSVSTQVGTLQQTLQDQLTLFIQQSLSAPTSNTPDLQLELPASAGGNLDSSPVGVKAVVTAEVRAMGAAGQPVNPAAIQYLGMADAALTAGQYKAAYADYRTAYTDAVG